MIGSSGTSHMHEHEGRDARSLHRCPLTLANRSTEERRRGMAPDLLSVQRVCSILRNTSETPRHVSTQRGSDLRKRGRRRSAKWVILPSRKRSGDLTHGHLTGEL